MGFFQKRRLEKLARTLALITALSTACASKSEKFVQFVASGDQDTAAQLIKDPTKKKEWEKALAGIKQIQTYLDNYNREFDKYRIKRIDPREVKVFIPQFWYGLNGTFESSSGLKGRHYQEANLAMVRSIRGAGLHETAQMWQERLLNDCLIDDKIIAWAINYELAEWKSYPKRSGQKNKAAHANLLKKEKILELMQITLPKARKAGFTRTAEAIQNALNELRATFF